MTISAKPSPEPAAAAPHGRPVGPRDIVAAGLCIGCGSCVAQSGAPDAAMRWDRYGQLKPSGGGWRKRPSAGFTRTCPFSPGARGEDELALLQFPTARHADPQVGRFEAAYVGHVAEAGFRADGSSGGMVSWVAAELLRRGLVDGVAHVTAVREPQREQRFFRYTISRTEADVRAGAKSRYYPIELSAMLETIRSTPGRYAVVGIPCFIKAVNLLRLEDDIFRERIAFTLGLFCGHMKSARFVESFALQMGVDPAAIAGVDFREKNPDRPANWYTAQLTLSDGSVHRKDWWHLVDGDWGSGFFQNAACNFCDDVVAETADISFGDAWVEPYSSDGRGTNVVVVRSPALNRLLSEAATEGRLDLREVDGDFVGQTQAAGFRQRREGLSYRLRLRRFPFRLRKRVFDDPPPIELRRRLVYRLRGNISAWSHRVFGLARGTGLPFLYLGWARAALTLYHGLVYSRDRCGYVFDLLLGRREARRRQDRDG
ncbi:Coenzyme F420 hydrogenase/dehydrogenase, beta subunit C-terminal domain [Kumtagia ephedrae]|jgi:coenzyme F420-reducing hydrogenase beta subunit|nr:Coenzyme F420 hydrogenase/dehydrogenase, beta subunit C-terminal domain [Mesorhizobium ephedrae]